MVFLHEIENVFLARDDVFGAHGARALVAPHIVVGDGLQNVLALLERDLLAAGHRAEAVAVGHDESAGHFAHFRELGVVDLAAGDEHTRTVPRLRVRLARAQLLQRLAQVGQDEILRARLRAQLDDVEFIARDDGVFRLAHGVDLRHDAADLVELLNGAAQVVFREVHAVDLLERLNDLLLDLAAVVARVPLGLAQRHVEIRAEKFLVRDQLAVFKILLHAVHRRAALLPDERGDEVVAALERALEDALGVRARAVGHIIGSHVGIGAVRRAQTHAKTLVRIQQNLRYVRTVPCQRQPPVPTGGLNQVVVCLLQQVFKIDQMLQVSHSRIPSFDAQIPRSR